MKQSRHRTRRASLVCFVAFMMPSVLFGQVFPFPESEAVNETESTVLPMPSQPEVSSSTVQTNSLRILVDSVAQAMEEKAKAENLQGPLRVEVTAGRGISEKGLENAFMTRLRVRLRKGRLVFPASRAPARCRIVLSVEKNHVWAVGLFEGAQMIGPAPFAVSHPLDRSLEVVFGKGARQRQTRWNWRRIGPISGGTLDLVAQDLNGDLIDEIIVLSVDGLQVYQFLPGDVKPNRVGDIFALPKARPWPRIVTGWLAEAGPKQFWLATSAGHAYSLDLSSEKFQRPPRKGIPIRQSPMLDGTRGDAFFLLSGRYGDSSLVLPVVDSRGKPLRAPRFVQPIRDLAHISSESNAWIWVTDQGTIMARNGRSPKKELNGVGRVGDRILCSDLNQDGSLELLVSGAVYADEPDEITVYRLDQNVTEVSEVFRAGLGGGEVVAMVMAALDLDENPDILIVEGTRESEDILWRLEYSP
jgi:hypothetical protein